MKRLKNKIIPRLILLVALSVVLNQYGFGQTNMEETGSRITPADAQKILEHHNLARREVGVPDLEWSRELAAFAQEWADRLAKNGCRMEHRKQPMIRNEPVGENLYWGSSAEVYHPIDASLSWYSEKKIFKYGKFGKGNWQATGHYTQMVWKSTRQVGVGVAICKNGALMVVANYGPAGNYMDQLPY
jgi:pathogenesis-related protein 1